MEEETTEEEQLESRFKAAADAFLEQRIRQIVREEIEKAMQQRLSWLRAQTGMRDYEVK